MRAGAPTSLRCRHTSAMQWVQTLDLARRHAMAGDGVRSAEMYRSAIRAMKRNHDDEDAEPEMRVVLCDAMSLAVDELVSVEREMHTRSTGPSAEPPPPTEDDMFKTYPKSDDAWNAVVGQQEAKTALLLATEWVTEGDPPFRSVLLYGLPGTAKTTLARALATRVGRPFACISSSDLVSKWQGESEKQIIRLFQRAAKCRGIVFIDEVESLCRARGPSDDDSTLRIKNAMLTGSDIPGDWVLIFATNNPAWLDKAMLRRCEERVYCRLPTAEERRVLLGSLATDETVAKTERFSGSDIERLLRVARKIPRGRAMNRNLFFEKDGKFDPCSHGEEGCDCAPNPPLRLVRIPPASEEDLLEALSKVVSTSTSEDIEASDAWHEREGGGGA